MPTGGLTPAHVEELYASYAYLLHRRCRAILRDPTLAEDALQDTFVRLLRGGAGLLGAPEPLRFLYRVADSACFDRLRRRRRSVEVPEPDEVGEAPGADPVLRHAVVDLLEELDDVDRRLAVLAWIDGLTQGEVAREVGLSRVTVNKRLMAVRARAARAFDSSRTRLEDPSP